MISQKSLINENQRFRDIVQGNFEEAYRNLTYKHLMGLEWASRNCKNADIIIKMDDDMVYSISNILSYLKTIKVTDKSSFLLGYVMKAMRPIRNRANKWFVTYSEYSKSFYPPFLSGWMYFTTPLTASRLVQMASNFPYFWIDDVFISGMIASSLNIKLLDVRNSSIFLEYYELMKCCLEDMLNKNIYCEFAVGPNGGDDNMLIKFDNALSHCDKIKCSKRPSNLPLKDTCVTSKDLMPFHKGNPVVDIIKL